MNSEKAVGVAALLWLIWAFALMARSVQRGRRLADDLAVRHPRLYESMGRPRPGYFDSMQRSRFAQFVGRREFEALEDPTLVAGFEAHRKAENRSLLVLLASLALLGTVIGLVRYAA